MRISSLLTRCGLALVSLGLVSCQRSQLHIDPGVSLQLAEYRSTVIQDLNYRLHLDIPAQEDADIDGRIVIDFRLSDASRDLQLDFREDGSRLRQVTVNGADTAIDFRKEHLVVPRGRLTEGDNRIQVDFVAGSSSLNRNPDYLYTLFVPDRARTAFPLFDQPDLKATWELSLALPVGWAAQSAAPVDRVETRGDRQTIHFQRSDLISSYLFSFVAGEFETITREVGGRRITLLHRETDADKVKRNVDEVFRLHAEAIAWLEQYTGIDYPFKKFDFALLPAHPYGGMEHVGAIQYRAESLWLEEAPSDTELLNRASLIAHETAHMWFGNLVTMRWFDDVWTKEVFANFMAAKIVNPSFPSINHDLNFLVSHHPSAYSVDRTAGANPIRQALPNLNQAGQLYGAIIYHKAPIMMRQLELLLGEGAFQEGLREYLLSFAHGNATWPELIEIFDRRSAEDLAAWSEIWVNSPGRPRFTLAQGEAGEVFEQLDPAGLDRLWPQTFSVQGLAQEEPQSESLAFLGRVTRLPDRLKSAQLVVNADGLGYGLFPAALDTLDHWPRLGDVSRASLLINLYEQMLDSGRPAPAAYLERLAPIIENTQNQLLLNLTLGQLRHIYWVLLPDKARNGVAAQLEAVLWRAMLATEDESLRKVYFNAFADVALTAEGIQRVSGVWGDTLQVERLPLSERDLIALTRLLAIKRPDNAESIIERQLARTANPDERRRLEFMAPSLSASKEERDAFFASLADEANRRTESWVLDALDNLHHPLRTASSESYILPGLELLEEIQVTGDIFFPAGWLRSSLGSHSSGAVVEVVESFLAERPGYNPQLRMKVLQAADAPLRAHRLLTQRSGT